MLANHVGTEDMSLVGLDVRPLQFLSTAYNCLLPALKVPLFHYLSAYCSAVNLSAHVSCAIKSAQTDVSIISAT